MEPRTLRRVPRHSAPRGEGDTRKQGAGDGAGRRIAIRRHPHQRRQGGQGQRDGNRERDGLTAAKGNRPICGVKGFDFLPKE